MQKTPMAPCRGPLGAGRRVDVPALVLFVWLAVSCQLVQGASGGIRTASGHGLQMTVDTRWVEGSGYRPVRIIFQPTTPNPTVADRPLTVEFLVRSGWASEYDIRVARDIEIPAGTSGPIQTTFSVPPHAAWNRYAVNIVEDGTLLKWLGTGWVSASSSSNGWEDCLPAMLVVGDALPDTRPLGTLLPVQQYNQYRSTTSSLVTGQLPTAAACRLVELPGRWIDYSSLDVFCLSLDELGQLKRKHPATFQAVLHWTAAGGNLFVYAIGQDWQRRGELEKLVGLPPGSMARSLWGDCGWMEPDKKDFGRSLHTTLYGKATPGETAAYGAVTYAVPGAMPMLAEEAQARPPVRRPSEAPEQAHFMLRRYNAGLIVALASGEPFPGKREEWGWVFNAMGSDRWLWHQRHGMSIARENPDYWKFLIEGVGLAPVTAFCILITLFVLAIGPLNYWLLRRFRRLHLLVVSIPVSAAAVTLLLFGYALVNDGLGTRVRARSVTLIDQGLGEATCWARLSYYAGLAPSRGLTFPDDVAVLPLQDVPAHYNPQKALRRELIWEEREGESRPVQWLASGWLSSRTPTQYLTVRSRRSGRGLKLIRSGGTSGQLQVENRLGTRIKQLLVRPEDGKCYWAEGIDPDQTAVLKPFGNQARAKLQQAYRRSLPKLPRGVENQNRGGIFGISGRRRFYYGYGWGGPAGMRAPAQRTGRLEQLLASFEGSRGADTTLLEPGNYLAVTEHAPEVTLGVPTAREEASYHAILGKW